MKIEIISKVENGRLSRNRKLIEDTIKSFEGKEIVLSIEKKKKKRTGQQNRYLHLLFTIFANELNELGNKFTAQEVKDLCKFKFALIDVINESTGEVIGQRIQGTSEMTTTELNSFIEDVIQWAAEMFDIQLPYPNEELEMKF
jgi:hypothetical protein